MHCNSLTSHPASPMTAATSAAWTQRALRSTQLPRGLIFPVKAFFLHPPERRGGMPPQTSRRWSRQIPSYGDPSAVPPSAGTAFVLAVKWAGHAHCTIGQLIVLAREQARPVFTAAGDPPGGLFPLPAVDAGLIAMHIPDLHLSCPLAPRFFLGDFSCSMWAGRGFWLSLSTAGSSSGSRYS